MKRAAIITITNSGMNFGNRLQNYALQKAFEKQGVEVNTVYSSKNIYNSIILSKLRNALKGLIKNDKRRQCFNDFDKKNINKEKKIRFENLNDDEYNEMYDAFIVGSDQVWNPNFHFNSDFEFLTFADKHKRFSYAASFGVDRIPDSCKENYKTQLTDMQSISVREFDGKRIVENLTGKEAFVHVDPTMLLEEEEYQLIEEVPKTEVPEKYILEYYLGNKNEKYKIFIEKLSAELGAKVISLSESKNTYFYNIGPQHFIYLLRHSEYICTDSFHGTVFAIIFNKFFTVFERKDDDEIMNSRIKTILQKTSLEERLFGNLDISSSLKPIKYDDINKTIKKEQKIAYTYIKEMINKW